jgi:hypothetical protein
MPFLDLRAEMKSRTATEAMEIISPIMVTISNAPPRFVGVTAEAKGATKVELGELIRTAAEQEEREGGGEVEKEVKEEEGEEEEVEADEGEVDEGAVEVEVEEEERGIEGRRVYASLSLSSAASSVSSVSSCR